MRRLLTLQGTMKAHQIITLMQYAGTDNTYAMADHDDHIHVGFQPRYGANAAAGAARRDHQAGSVEPPRRASLAIQNPTVPVKPSRYSIKVKLRKR